MTPIDEFIRANRVFILGAGFSSGAGVPLTTALLTNSMLMFARECSGIYARVLAYTAEMLDIEEAQVDYSKVNLSDLCTYLEFIELREFGGGERWNAAGSREKLALRYYLAKTLVEKTPARDQLPSVYLEFARQLQPHDIVISFNWDPLLERCLQALGKPYTYNFRDSESIKLCKLHGSVNWRLDSYRDWQGNVIDTLDWASLKFTEGMMTVETYASEALLSTAPWLGTQPLGEIEPFLVLPGYGKAFDVRSNAVLWYKPEFAFAMTYDVYILGLSLSHDDFFIRSFFLSNLPYLGSDGRKVFVVNPDRQCRVNYEFLLSRPHGVFLNENFEMKHVELMKARLIGD